MSTLSPASRAGLAALSVGGAALLALCTIPGALTASVATDEAPPSWDLRETYPDEAAWNRAVGDVRERVARFAKLRDVRVEDARRLADRLDEAGELRGRAGSLARFALLTASLDTADVPAKTRLEAATALEAAVEGAVSWLDEVVLRLGSRRVTAWASVEPRLRRHGWPLAQARLQDGHTLPPGTGPAYASLERASRASSAIYDELMASDLGWPSIVGEAGRKVTVDPNTFAGLAGSDDTEVRRSAVAAYAGRLRSLAAPLGLLLTRHLEADMQLARARGFADGIDAAFLLGDGVPPATYGRMVEAARADRATALRYARILARLHRIPDVRYADLGLQGRPFERELPLAAARELVLASLEPLGADYQRLVRERFALPWFDLAPRPHKNLGNQGVYWQVGGGHPYVLLSHHPTLAGARGLAGAAAILQFYADIPPEKAPEKRESDFPIYGNTIWFCGQLLLYDYLGTHSSTRDERIAVLSHDLYRLWNIYFGGVVATDFEARLSRAVAAGAPPVGSEISSLYLSTLRDYYPAGEHAPVVAEDDGTEWMTFANMYYGHVLTEWAFAMATAAAVVERLEAGDSRTLDAVRHPMARPESFSSFDLLRDAGADPSLDATYRPIVRRMEREMDLLEKELP